MGIFIRLLTSYYIADPCSLGIGAGGIYINNEFEKHLASALRSQSKTTQLDDILEEALQDFENQAKRTYEKPTDSCYVRLGGIIWEDEVLGIIGGRLHLDGYVVGHYIKAGYSLTYTQLPSTFSQAMDSFFKPSIEKIMKAASDLADGVDVGWSSSLTKHPLSDIDIVQQYVILTGGFGGSKYLKREFREAFHRGTCKVVSPDDAAM